MKQLRLVTVIGILLLLAIPSGFAQKKGYDSLRDAIFSAGRLNSPGAPSNITWIEGGDKYSFTKNDGESQQIWTKTVKSLKEEMVFSSEGLTFPDTGEPFTYISFQWANNYKNLLFQTNFNPIWRYSGNSDYYLYSVEAKTLKLVAKQAFTAEVSPNGKKVGYGKDGDLFEFILASEEIVRLTHDAYGQIYNGRFGWAQEEEFGLVQGWSWSNDSRFIAFWQSDETEVPIYRLTDFSGQHPEYMEVPYQRWEIIHQLLRLECLIQS
jgi:dipeptidyl-peptidase-4